MSIIQVKHCTLEMVNLYEQSEVWISMTDKIVLMLLLFWRMSKFKHSNLFFWFAIYSKNEFVKNMR